MTNNEATAYRRGDKIYLHPTSHTVGGVGLFTEPAVAVSMENVEEIGNKLLEALSYSRNGLSMPTDWKGFFDPMLNLAGVKSWNMFVKGAKCVGIEQQGDTLLFHPDRYIKKGSYFKRIEEKTCQVPLSTPADVGLALLSAFEDAE